MSTHNIKFNLFFPLFGLCCSLFILGVALKLGTTPQLFLGVMLLVMSLLQFTVPVVVVDEHEIQVKNLFGMTLKRYAYQPGEISFQGLRMMHNGRKVRGMSTFALDRRALERLKRDMESRQGAPEARVHREA